MRLALLTSLAFAALGASGSAVAEQALVHQVIDGDTIYVCGSGCHTIRIANIDAPELPPRAKCDREAEMALRAARSLTSAIEGRTVELVPEPRPRDRYGRLLARVYLGGRDVGQGLVAQGLARPWTGKREPWC